jgi:thymidylate synthase
MKVIKVRNVHEAFPTALLILFQEGVERDSRNGKVLVHPEPVTTVYEKPKERVLFWAERNANPFFHLFEALWMINGNKDVAFISQFVKRMQDFSDDGKTFHGAYGYRWRDHFKIDQLLTIIKILQNNPEDRRCVLQMWDPKADLGQEGKDFPCNTQVYFTINHEGNLDMTVCNRSNDIVWGCYGANAVHFSFLQEFVASCIGCEVGRYYQISNNWHGYLETVEPYRHLSMNGYENPYTDKTTDQKLFPIMQTPKGQWLIDLRMFMETGAVLGLRDPFFRRVVVPMYEAFLAYKHRKGPERYEMALDHLERCDAFDWRIASQQWILRRKEKGNENA